MSVCNSVTSWGHGMAEGAQRGFKGSAGGGGWHLMRRFLCRRAYVDYDVCSLWVSTWSARTSLYNKSLETVRGVREINVKHFSLSSVRSMKIDVHFDIWAERQRDRRELALLRLGSSPTRNTRTHIQMIDV